MKGKRILSAVLSAALLLQLSPLAAFAEDTSLLPVTAQTALTEPAPEPAGEETALPEEPAPEETAVPMAAPTPEPTAEPTATPAAEESAPDAAETPAPVPSAEPTAAPDPAAEVQALIDALPDEVTEDNAEAVEQALTDIDDAKESLTDDELAGLDFARYDAAANALLALWGEAPADAVETLDNYQEPGKDATGSYYQITNENDLRWFAQAVNGGKKPIKARLMNDITMDGTEWTPIGTERKPFEGTFDGNGKTITGLTCTDQSKDYVGLVGFADGATIQDVTVKDSDFNGNQYIGAVCGFIVGRTVFGGTITGCTNSGSTVKGWANSGSSGNPGRNIGGIVGRAKDATVQRCVNTGDVTGINNLGGIVGCTEDATVQDCGNTGEVRPTGEGIFYGGIAGYVLGSSYIRNCYNADSFTADKIYGGGSCSHSNCYYLADSSDSTDKDIIAKTQEQFTSGEVAFLLQNGRTDAVWGQTLTGASPQALPVLGGAKVYQTTPCTAGYSNTQGEVRQHNYVDGVCSNCGASQPLEEVLVDGYYQIYTADQLRQFAEKVTSGNYNINARLMADIELNGKNKVLDDKGNLIADTSSLKEWTPIGIFNTSFTGTFDGNNKTIYGLYIKKTTSDVGLFVKVGKRGSVIGTVKDVTLADSYVSGNSAVGGICAYNDGGTLLNCHNTGMVSGAQYVGGVCSINRDGGTIQKCDNSGTVSGTNNKIGGVCGSNTGDVNGSPTTIQECYNTGTVSGKGSVGGVCGYNKGSTLQKCYNTGKVTGTMNRVGGVCGENASGTVKGCYTTGKVTGNYPVGSVCGWNGGGTVEKCYYLAGTSAKAVGDGSGNRNETCASKTELQFQNGDVAFCLQKDLGTTAPQVWGQRIGNTGETDKTPVLSNNPDYAVHPTATDSLCKGYSNKPDQKFDEHQYDKTGVCSRCGAWEPAEEQNGYYQITNQGQLRWFANLINTTSSSETKLNARLMNDITMDGTEWTPIGTKTNPFTGEFDGDGHTISKLTCTDAGAEYVGLVGYASGATIQNVTVQDSSFNGWKYIGAVCGSIKDGTITGCTNSGSAVSGGYCLGGIAGYAGNTNKEENRTVQRCFNSGAVTVVYGKASGIVGQAEDATVQDCGNIGAVTPADGYDPVYYGGIVGEDLSGSTIQNCYNTDSNTAAKICGYGWCSPSNCYYLADAPDSSGSTGTDIIAKTAEQFASGEVAYLLQKGREQAVWGQKIDTDDYPKLGGDKVYQSAPCKSEYTNTESKTVEHVFGSDGICEKCGQPQIAYTVTIPATVELGNKATIKAKDVILPNGKTLNVKVAEGSEFKVAQVDDNDAVVDKCAYTVTKGETKTPVNPSDTVLTAVKGESEKTVELQFNKPETTTYSGEYKGTVKFTVSVDDKPAS